MPRSGVLDLCRALRDVLAKGLEQDEDALRAIAGWHGQATPDILAELLRDREGSDAAVIMSLLLHPSDSLMAEFEPGLERADCTAHEAQEVADLLADPPPRAAIIFPDGSRLDPTLTPDEVRTFVASMRLDATPPMPLRQAVDARCAPRLAARIKAALRHAPVILTPERAAFVQAAIQGARTGDEALVELAGYAARFMEGLTPAETPAQGLARRQRTVANQLKQARRQRQAMESSSFEVMIAQGARLPHLDEEALRRELALLLELARAVGLAGAAGDVVDRDLGEGLDAEDIIDRLGGLNGFF